MLLRSEGMRPTISQGAITAYRAEVCGAKDHIVRNHPVASGIRAVSRGMNLET